MKKTIAILLVLVVGIAGIFATNPSREEASITVNASVLPEFSLGVTGPTATLTDSDFSDLETFETKALDAYSYGVENTPELIDFAATNGINVALVHAYSNLAIGVTIKIDSVTDGYKFKGGSLEQEVPFNVRLISTDNHTVEEGGQSVKLSGAPQPTGDSATEKPKLMNVPVNVTVESADAHMAVVDSYTATITLSISSP